MKLLGLPGRKASTQGQMIELLGAVRLGQSETAVQAYGFWGHEDVADPDVTGEASIAAASGAQMVIAKSIGTLVCMLAEERHGFAPDRCVFYGVPLRRLEAKGELDLLVAHCRRTPTQIIQQTADFNGAFADLAARVSPWARCVEVPGEDHLYSDVAPLAAAIEAWARG